MPAGWVYDNALKGMAEHVDGELKECLLTSLTDVNGGYLNMQTASADEIHTLRMALQTHICSVMEAGPSTWYQPEFFDGYLRQLRELEVMLATRLSESSAYLSERSLGAIGC